MEPLFFRPVQGSRAFLTPSTFYLKSGSLGGQRIGHAMPLLRSSRRILLGEKVTRADVFDAHSERVIAEGRILLCVLSLLGIWLDPMQLADSATATKVLLAYSALALALVAIPFWKFPGPVVGYIVHATDIGFLAALVTLSHAKPSPF